MKYTRAAPIVLASIFVANGAAANTPFASADAFVRKNCLACHSSTAPAARLDLTKLSYDPANPDNFAVWVKIHDRVSSGEMPPAPIPKPPAESVTQFVNGLSDRSHWIRTRHCCRARPSGTSKA